MKALLCLLVFLPFLPNGVHMIPMPKAFMPCHKSSPEFLECLGKSIQAAVQSLVKENTDLKVPSIEPYYLPAANLGKGASVVDVQQDYSNIYIHGLSKVDSVKVKKIDLEKFYIEFETFHPNLRWQAHYKASGKLLMLPIYGEGEATMTLYNTTSSHKITGERFTKKGHMFAKSNTYELKFEPTNVVSIFENLFNGNKMLADNMQQVMQENWKELFKDVKGGYEGAISEILRSYVNQIFGRIPYNEIFLD